MEVISGPNIEARPVRNMVGIRTLAPFRGMLAERDRLETELFGWLAAKGISGDGPVFLRLHVIDMSGTMDIEVGAISPVPVQGDSRVRPGVLPAGNYATLTYLDHSLRANRLLLDWIESRNIALDRQQVPEGDRFGCRCEIWLTDPRHEPRKKKRPVQLDFLTRT